MKYYSGPQLPLARRWALTRPPNEPIGKQEFRMAPKRGGFAPLGRDFCCVKYNEKGDNDINIKKGYVRVVPLMLVPRAVGHAST
jgi:hypothetical protein